MLSYVNILIYNFVFKVNSVILGSNLGNPDTELLEKGMSSFWETWSMLINGFLGVGALIGLLAMGMSLTVIIKDSDNPKKRSEGIDGLIKACFYTGCIGGFGIFVNVLFNIIL